MQRKILKDVKPSRKNETHSVFLANFKIEEKLVMLNKFWELLTPMYIKQKNSKEYKFEIDDSGLLDLELVLLLGSNDLSPVKKTISLYEKNPRIKIITSGCGGHATVPFPMLTPTEADHYRNVLVDEYKISAEDIFIENNSRNTGENIKFSQKIIEDIYKKKYPKRIAIIQTPSAQLRANLTFEKQWSLDWDYYVSFPPTLPKTDNLSSAVIDFYLAYALREFVTLADYINKDKYVTKGYLSKDFDDLKENILDLYCSFFCMEKSKVSFDSRVVEFFRNTIFGEMENDYIK
jgi:hypothetical protein